MELDDRPVEEGDDLDGATETRSAGDLVESDLPEAELLTPDASDLDMSVAETEIDQVDSSIEIIETKVVVAASSNHDSLGTFGLSSPLSNVLHR